MGTVMIPIKYPITTIVDVIISSCVQFRMRIDMASKKHIPQMKESLDKNKSHRMNDFPVK